MQEQEIIRLMKQRDEHGAEAFLQYYTPLLRYVIAPILPNEKDQEDCLSEISLRVWNNIGSYNPSRDSWTAWLTALGRNAALNHARQARHTAGEEALSDQIPARELTPEAAALLKEQQEALQRALQRLSPGEKQLLYRKYYYLQSTAQIAAELGTTERAVEGKLYRLKKRLRKWMGGEHHA